MDDQQDPTHSRRIGQLTEIEEISNDDGTIIEQRNNRLSIPMYTEVPLPIDDNQQFDSISLSKEDYEEFNKAPIRNSFNHMTRRPTF